MKVNGRNLGMLFLLGALLLPAGALAQAGAGPGACPGCGRRGGPGARMFDPSAVTTIKGEIVEIQRLERGRRHQGVHLTIAMGSERVGVYLGPDFYVDAQAVKLASGDTVEVKGARTVFDGQPVIIAQEVRRGGEVLQLRDESGVPLWRGSGMRWR